MNSLSQTENLNKIIVLGCLKPEREIKDNYLVYGGGVFALLLTL